MFTVARLNRSVRLVATMFAPLALAGILIPTAASAQDITESVDILNRYGTEFSGTAAAGGQNESNVTIYSGSYAPNAESELGINYTATVDGATGGFFFLHDNYCVGTCSTVSDTTITFTVTNNSRTGQAIWFHSQITPGHLAKIYEGGDAGFDFTVSRDESRLPLYRAFGGVNSDGNIFLNTGNLVYNGLSNATGFGDVVFGDNYQLLDWQTTNLSIFAGDLAGGATMQIQYKATYFSSNQAGCADVLVCSGAQVVFGDPRNNGGISVSSFAAFAALDEPAPANPLAVIGADYGVFEVPYAFTLDGDSPFATPGTEADLIYGPLYRSRGNAIPEPESWALMILGFGAAGTAMRRQRSRLRVANA